MAREGEGKGERDMHILCLAACLGVLGRLKIEDWLYYSTVAMGRLHDAVIYWVVGGKARHPFWGVLLLRGGIFRPGHARRLRVSSSVNAAFLLIEQITG